MPDLAYLLNENTWNLWLVNEYKNIVVFTILWEIGGDSLEKSDFHV